jgi:hypothetical protein
MKRMLAVGAIVALLAIFAATISFAGSTVKESRPAEIRGGGTTIVEGGTGEPAFTPVTTKFAFRWREGRGHFECLALAPSQAAGEPGSGEFDTNVMYVTGPITSAAVRGHKAVLSGTATVTGIGAGTDEEFTIQITEGGPGATLVLRVSGLTFREILLDGEINF